MIAKTDSTQIIPPDKNALVFALPALMTIETAEALAAEFKQLSLAEKTSLTLDASKVEKITTPGLQIIISLDKTLSAQGGTLKLDGAGDSFIRAFKESGLENLLTKSS